MRESLHFERKLVELAQEWADERDLNFTQFAKLAFGDTPDSVGRWRRMRNISSPIGRPQSVTVHDLYCVAQAMGKTPSELCFSVEQRLKHDGQTSK